ncbi:hypothetical protein NMG60_11004220 [Bertholletia excelsa]
MEEYPQIPMERTGKILRRSIHQFLKNYQYFTVASALFALPFSAAILLSQALCPFSALLPAIHARLRSLFDAAGFPPSSELFTVLNLKLSQTITSSVLVLPFTLSSLLLAKASILQALGNNPNRRSLQPTLYSIISTYNHILVTQIYNFFLILAANATCFSFLFIVFNCLEGFGYSSRNSVLFVSASGAVFYSIVLANALIVCNLSLVSAGLDKGGGVNSILKACILLRGRTATALSLALPVNMLLAAIEALFQYRVVRAYSVTKSSNSSLVLEGILIAYLYSIITVIETIVSCVFFKSCKAAYRVDQEGGYTYRIETEAANVKVQEDLP